MEKVPLERAVAPADVESAAERERYAALDPHNAIRLIEPAAAAAGADVVSQWLEIGVLTQDSGRAMYRYTQEYTLAELGGRTLIRRGIICAARFPSLADGGVKLHQAVREEEVAAQAALYERLRLHAAPVLAAYRDPSTEIERLFRKLELGLPTYQVQTPDGTIHRVWRCGDSEIIGKVRQLLMQRKLYVLEGHERLAAMQQAGVKLDAAADPMPPYAAGNYALTCLVNLEDQALLPSSVHRLVSGPALPHAEVLARAARYFSVTKLDGLAQSPAKLAKVIDEWASSQACLGLAFPGVPDVWLLTLLPAVVPRDEGVEGHPAVTRLDPWVIEEMFLRRVLGQPAAASSAAAPAVPAAAPATAVVPEVAVPAAGTPPSGTPTTPAPAAAVPVAAAAPVAAPTSAPAAAVPAAAGEMTMGGWPVSLVHTVSAVLSSLGHRGVWMAVLARPLTMNQMVHVADLAAEVPPRSTHFAPPLLGGLAMLRLTADEDLV